MGLRHLHELDQAPPQGPQRPPPQVPPPPGIAWVEPPGPRHAAHNGVKHRNLALFVRPRSPAARRRGGASCLLPPAGHGHVSFFAESDARPTTRSADIGYGSGSQQQAVTGNADAGDPGSYWQVMTSSSHPMPSYLISSHLTPPRLTSSPGRSGRRRRTRPRASASRASCSVRFTRVPPVRRRTVLHGRLLQGAGGWLHRARLEDPAAPPHDQEESALARAVPSENRQPRL